MKLFSQSNFPTFACGTPPLDQNEHLLPTVQKCNFSFSSFTQNHTDDMIPTGVTRNLKIRTNVILVQDENGNGNFKLSNSEDVAFLNAIYSDMNSRINNLYGTNCGCSISPIFYSNIHIEFVPTFIEVKHPTLWNHNNDPDPNHDSPFVNSTDKPYLNAINNLAQQTPGYQDGFNVIITTDGVYYNLLNNQPAPRKPLWELGYNHYYAGHWYSAYPSDDLNFPAMWHAPDMYLWYKNGKEFIGDWWINSTYLSFCSGGFIHEYGHYFGLGHEECDQNNIMHTSGSTPRNSLNGCQVREMYKTLMVKNLRKYVVCEDVLEYNLTVDNNENWTRDMKVYGNIVIESGGTLTISCKLNMQPKTKIIVKRGGKFILDEDAVMTGCGDYWDGIIVEGDVPSGNQLNAGKVELRNGSIIENAKNAISMNPSHRPWNNGQYQDYFGGFIQANGATIRNGFKAVEFMKFGVKLVKDGSTFVNCKFENLREGVTIWSDNGLSFNKCTFTNITNRGIQPYDSDVNVFNGCSFNGVKTGIDIVTTYPIPFAPQIGNLNSLANNFSCFEHGIFANASGNIQNMSVVNNNFTGGTTGIESSGISHYLIERNTFSDQVFNVVPMDGGYNSDYIQYNKMNHTTLAAHNVFNNSGLEYLGNCFGNNLGDIYVNNGDLYLYQGSPQMEAGNCFTRNGVFEIDNTDGNTIAYFEKQGSTTSSCKHPVHSFNINVERTANLDRPWVCGSTSITSTGGGTLSERCTSFNENMTIAQLINEMNQIIQSISSLSNSTATSSNTYQLTSLRMCLREVQILIGKKGYENLAGDPSGGVENMITFYSSQPEFMNKITAYGMMLYNGEIGRARTYLNALVTSTTEEYDFKAAQFINLDYLSDVKSYQLSATNKNLLYNIGKRAYPLNGYARSLYQVLTGERLELEKPNIGNRSSRGGELFSNLNEGIYSAPNPVSNGTHIIYFNSKQHDQDFKIQLVDVNGQNVYFGQSIGKLEYEINTSDLTDGLYFLRISNQLGETAYQAKLVVMNR